jgi:hypothetical protein
VSRVRVIAWLQHLTASAVPCQRLGRSLLYPCPWSAPVSHGCRSRVPRSNWLSWSIMACLKPTSYTPSIDVEPMSLDSAHATEVTVRSRRRGAQFPSMGAYPKDVVGLSGVLLPPSFGGHIDLCVACDNRFAALSGARLISVCRPSARSAQVRSTL